MTKTSKKWNRRGKLFGFKKKLFNSVLDQVENVLPLMPFTSNYCHTGLKSGKKCKFWEMTGNSMKREEIE